MDDAARIEAHYAGLTQWKAEQMALRDLLRSLPLTEELKWHQPVYTHQGGNVCMPAGFKDRCVLSFFKGALLPDPAGILTPTGQNTRGARVITFHTLAEIAAMTDTLRAYVEAAMAMGFDRQEARALVLGTIEGATAMALEPGAPGLEDLRNSVTSKGGTTAAGLDALNGDGTISRKMRETLEAAYNRAVELR